MVSILPLVSSSPNLFSIFMESISKTHNTVGIIVIFMFHNYFCSVPRSKYLSRFSISFIFTLMCWETTKFSRWQVYFFWIIKTGSNPLTWTEESIFILKSTRKILRVLSSFRDLVVSVVKYQSLAQFSVNHLSNPIMRALIFLLGQFAVSTY